jgi:hypothetical protein
VNEEKIKCDGKKDEAGRGIGWKTGGERVKRLDLF